MFQKYQCPDCGSSAGYRSRPRNFSEKYVLPLFLLKPVRCANCYRRTNASRFADVPVREHVTAVKRQAAA